MPNVLSGDGNHDWSSTEFVFKDEIRLARLDGALKFGKKWGGGGGGGGGGKAKKSKKVGGGGKAGHASPKKKIKKTAQANITVPGLEGIDLRMRLQVQYQVEGAATNSCLQVQYQVQGARAASERKKLTGCGSTDAQKSDEELAELVHESVLRAKRSVSSAQTRRTTTQYADLAQAAALTLSGSAKAGAAGLAARVGVKRLVLTRRSRVAWSSCWSRCCLLTPLWGLSVKSRATVSGGMLR
jgi:hypothetical protein